MMNTRFITILAVFLGLGLLLGPAVGYASDTNEQAVEGFRSTDLPLPRYVSLRSEKVYVRAGPALRYPIKWIYKRSGLPVEIIQEFENWRKIKDYEGEEGWVHQSLLSGERNVLVRQAEDLIPLREGFSNGARMIARLEPQVIANIDKCTGQWCRIETGGYRGWVQRNFLWGIYDDEELN